MAVDQEHTKRHICISCSKKRYEQYMKPFKFLNVYIDYDHYTLVWVCNSVNCLNSLNDRLIRSHTIINTLSTRVDNYINKKAGSA